MKAQYTVGPVSGPGPVVGACVLFASDSSDDALCNFVTC